VRRFAQPHDVLVPIAGVFLAILAAAALASASIAGTRITAGDWIALVVYSLCMALLASVRFPAKEGLVVATGMVASHAASGECNVLLGRSWHSLAVTIAVGGVVSLAVMGYSHWRGRRSPGRPTAISE